MRLLLIFLVLAALVLVPFLIWGGSLEAAFTREGAVEQLARYGNWAWVAGIVLLVLDLVLPVPSTAVFSGLGFIYGALAGGLIGSAGSILSGALGYGACRLFGRGAEIGRASCRERV